MEELGKETLALKREIALNATATFKTIQHVMQNRSLLFLAILIGCALHVSASDFTEGCAETEVNAQGQTCCAKCNPGNRIKDKCNVDESQRCQLCRDGKYILDPSKDKCTTCTACVGATENDDNHPCTKSQDRKCKCRNSDHVCVNDQCTSCREKQQPTTAAPPPPPVDNNPQGVDSQGTDPSGDNTQTDDQAGNNDDGSQMTDDNKDDQKPDTPGGDQKTEQTDRSDDGTLDISVFMTTSSTPEGSGMEDDSHEDHAPQPEGGPGPHRRHHHHGKRDKCERWIKNIQTQCTHGTFTWTPHHHHQQPNGGQ